MAKNIHVTINWVVIYPHENENKDKIKEEYEKLKLVDFTVKVIVINDNIFEKQEDEYVNFINKNIEYTGHIDVSKESELMATIEKMGGIDNEDVYLIKDNKTVHKKTKL